MTAWQYLKDFDTAAVLSWISITSLTWVLQASTQACKSIDWTECTHLICFCHRRSIDLKSIQQLSIASQFSYLESWERGSMLESKFARCLFKLIYHSYWVCLNHLYPYLALFPKRMSWGLRSFLNGADWSEKLSHPINTISNAGTLPRQGLWCTSVAFRKLQRKVTRSIKWLDCQAKGLLHPI